MLRQIIQTISQSIRLQRESVNFLPVARQPVLDPDRLNSFHKKTHGLERETRIGQRDDGNIKIVIVNFRRRSHESFVCCRFARL
jgi:hypothetical protein